jgi:hypothetical protein
MIDLRNPPLDPKRAPSLSAQDWLRDLLKLPKDRDRELPSLLVATGAQSRQVADAK